MAKARDFIRRKTSFIWIHKKYKGKWVALTLDEKEVIASGESLAQILEEAKKKGLEHPIVMKIPTEVVPLVGANELNDF